MSLPACGRSAEVFFPSRFEFAAGHFSVRQCEYSDHVGVSSSIAILPHHCSVMAPIPTGAVAKITVNVTILPGERLTF